MTALEEKVKRAITLLQMIEPEEGYWLAFSGGKDSCVIKQLAFEAGVSFEAHYNVTTIDPPDVIQFIREQHPDVIFDYPDRPFLARLVDWGFPSVRGRWCCKYYKEAGGNGRLVILGVRAVESPRRARRYSETMMHSSGKKDLVCPIVDWTDDDVWQYIKSRGLPYCKLYDEGWSRIGCLFCPFSTKTEKERQVQRYPKWRKAFVCAFNRLYARGRQSHVSKWNSGEEMFEWYLRR